MRTWTGTRLAATAVVALAVWLGGAATAADSPRWPWPLSPTPELVNAFRPPASDYGPGHRGIDLRGSAGQAVTASSAGTVSFAGSVAGRGVVVVRTGDLRITYEPVTAAVRLGDDVARGAVLGHLQWAGSHCAPDVCLHVGVRSRGSYVDPLPWFGPRPVRLKPLLEHERPPAEPMTSTPRGDQQHGRARDKARPRRGEDTGSALRLALGGALAVTAAGWAVGAARRTGQARG
jgi:murein DD-endopeptidase MepM/ murein hydrolase activator NlpD